MMPTSQAWRAPGALQQYLDPRRSSGEAFSPSNRKRATENPKEKGKAKSMKSIQVLQNGGAKEEHRRSYHRWGKFRPSLTTGRNLTTGMSLASSSELRQ